jgi:drug/metabolite transporter (DMT)-like permease
MERLPDHVKGLLITGGGILVLTPDSLLVRLISADAWTLLWWREVLMAVGLAMGLLAVYRGKTAAAFRAVGKSGCFIALTFAGSSISFILALTYTSVANTLVIVSAAPLFSAILARVFLAETVPRRTWVAILLALVGIALLVSDSLGRPSLLGDGCALLTALFMAMTLTITRHARAVSMIPAIAVSGVVGALAVWPLAQPLSVAEADVAFLAIMGLVMLPISFGAVTLGPRYLPAPEVSLLFLMETVLGPLWVWLVLGEDPGPRALLGGAIVVATLAGHSALGFRAYSLPKEALQERDGDLV